MVSVQQPPNLPIFDPHQHHSPLPMSDTKLESVSINTVTFPLSALRLEISRSNLKTDNATLPDADKTDTPQSSNKIKLLSSHNIELDVERKAIERSVVIRDKLQDVGENEEPIIVPDFEENVLRKVIEYCEHHTNDPLPPNRPTSDDDKHDDNDYDRYHSRRNPELSELDQKFIDSVDREMLFPLISAAHHLQIIDLVHVACKAFADTIRGKTPEQIREMHNLPDDLMEEEKAQIQKENEWASDN